MFFFLFEYRIYKMNNNTKTGSNNNRSGYLILIDLKILFYQKLL